MFKILFYLSIPFQCSSFNNSNANENIDEINKKTLTKNEIEEELQKYSKYSDYYRKNYILAFQNLKKAEKDFNDFSVDNELELRIGKNYDSLKATKKENEKYLNEMNAIKQQKNELFKRYMEEKENVAESISQWSQLLRKIDILSSESNKLIKNKT